MVTSYLGSLHAFSCSKHLPKSILRFAIQPLATFLASSRPSGNGLRGDRSITGAP